MKPTREQLLGALLTACTTIVLVVKQSVTGGMTAMDADWKETDYPRADNGKFGSGSGGRGAATPPALPWHPTGPWQKKPEGKPTPNWPPPAQSTPAKLGAPVQSISAGQLVRQISAMTLDDIKRLMGDPNAKYQRADAWHSQFTTWAAREYKGDKPSLNEAAKEFNALPDAQKRSIGIPR